ncbi:PEP-CTERM sorting domain-containing protein [Horticoccus luteus]|uniref:PEP-CTERM sorting domain-containing protein n=1 Tax=Horticoccus luteus TaxID=2862869 RepID=A0A8F9TU92_9BACT|nr:PEP-CTERM sorting domain-containing protein [Horticoccus luteus]QYM78230.1 PEP-CTERM sorting domain-containing protein [Horticoccus luteus]
MPAIPRSSFAKTLGVAVPASAALLASHAGAAIVSTDLGSGLAITPTGPNTSLYFSAAIDDVVGNTGRASYSSTDSFQFQVVFVQPSDMKPQFIGVGDSSFAVQTSSPFLKSYSSGDTVPGMADFSATSLVYDFTSGATYVGLRFGNDSVYHYGWAKVNIQTSTAEDKRMTLYGFAYNTVANESILAGETSAIPEPSTYAALAGLLAGSAALFRRRQLRRRAA